MAALRRCIVVVCVISRTNSGARAAAAAEPEVEEVEAERMLA